MVPNFFDFKVTLKFLTLQSEAMSSDNLLSQITYCRSVCKQLRERVMCLSKIVSSEWVLERGSGSGKVQYFTFKKSKERNKRNL